MHPLEKIAKQYFGVTDNLEETGYVLSDGTFLDLSGRHHAIGYERRGDRFVPKKRQPDYLYGQRNTDHRQLPSEIFQAVGTGEGSAAMFAFLRETGALRLMPGAGFLVARMPTVESVARVVREWHHAFGNEPLYVDVVSPGSRPDRASRVINPDDVRESQEFKRPSIGEVMSFLEDAFSSQGRLSGTKKVEEGIFWHLTENPDWKLDPTYRPISAYGMQRPVKTPGLFVTDHPIYWSSWMGKGPIYAVRVSVPKKAIPPPSHQHPEYLITDLSGVKVLEILPLAEAIARGQEEDRRGINWWDQDYGGFGGVADWKFYQKSYDEVGEREGLEGLEHA